MKKFLAILMAIAMLLAMAACGNLFLSRHRNRRKKTFRNLRFLKTSLGSAPHEKTARGASHVKI